MLKQISKKELIKVLEEGGCVERNACRQLLVRRKLTKEECDEYWKGCSIINYNTKMIIGYVRLSVYKAICC